MRLLLLTLLPFLLLTCASTPPAPIKELTSYEKGIMDWHQARNDRLNQPDGWLTLSGLFWLSPGENTFGGSRDNDLVFSGKRIPEFMGTLTLEDDSVRFRSTGDIEIAVNDSVVMEAGLRKDISGSPDILSWKSLSWYIIQRGDRIGVRLKDSQNPNFVHFKPTELFTVDTTWLIEATLQPFDSSTTVDIVNVLGDMSPNPTPGILHFEVNGKKQSLTPIADPGDERYFIIFGDATNGRSTYGAGRFLVIDAVDESGKTVIDFNKSYNMPCVFSPFATCPLPPEENILSVAIEAGEKDYGLLTKH